MRYRCVKAVYDLVRHLCICTESSCCWCNNVVALNRSHFLCNTYSSSKIVVWISVRYLSHFVSNSRNVHWVCFYLWAKLHSLIYVLKPIKQLAKLLLFDRSCISTIVIVLTTVEYVCAVFSKCDRWRHRSFADGNSAKPHNYECIYGLTRITSVDDKYFFGFNIDQRTLNWLLYLL